MTKGRHVSFFRWPGGREPGIPLLLVALAICMFAFGRLASDVKKGETYGFDRRILLAMRRPGDLAPLGSPAVQEAVRDISALGGVSVLGLVTAIAVGFLALDGKTHMAT